MALVTNTIDLESPDDVALADRMKSVSNWKQAAGADSNEVRTVGPFSRTSGFPGIGREPDVMAAAYEDVYDEILASSGRLSLS